MARAADPTVRAALIETAAQILATEGPSRLTLRHLAEQVGTSTMAIYTHFGGMDQLRVAVCTEGFRRLAGHLEAVDRSDDPVADLFALGAAYAANARENPHLYRAMFLDPLPLSAPVDLGVGAPAGADQPSVRRAPSPSGTASGNGDGTATDASGDALTGLLVESMATFEVLVAATARCVATGRFDADPNADPRALAGELWGATHGLVALELGGMLDRAQATTALASIARHLAIAFGDTPAAVEQSAATADRR